MQTLYNDGHIRGSTHLANGQEAVSVGIAVAARPTDVVTCTYRGHGTALALGVTPEGGARGDLWPLDRLRRRRRWVDAPRRHGGRPVSDVRDRRRRGARRRRCRATRWSRGTDDAAIAVFGDGSTNIGAFHEGLNLAGILKLPVVFVCENNLYGEYTRINLSTPVEHIADRAASYGMPGVAVDGQDVDEVIDAVGSALERARSGDGPTLLEMKTYRYSGHSRSDAGTYRPDGELDAWKQRDPIDILRNRLLEGGEVSAEQLTDLEAAVNDRVSAAVEAVLASPPPGIDEMLRHVTAAAV